MDNIDKAIMYVFEQSTNIGSYKKDAFKFLNSIKLKENYHKILLSKTLNLTKNSKIIFFCFQELERFINVDLRYMKLNGKDKEEFRRNLVFWITQVLVKKEIDVFVKNKYCQVLVSLFIIEYLKDWSSFFGDLFRIIKGFSGKKEFVVVVDIFLRILSTIDEEVVCKNYKRNQFQKLRNKKIKDKMRMGVVQEIVGFWVKILQSNNEYLTVFCLEIMANYIDWIDINLITSKEMTKIFFAFLKHEKYKNSTVNCLNSIVIKGTPPMIKLKLIEKMNLVSMVKFVIGKNIEDLKFLFEMAKITNSIGIQLIECTIRSSGNEASAAWKQLQDIIQAILIHFNHNNNKISSTVREFISEYVSVLRKKKKATKNLSNNENKQIKYILEIIMKKAKLPLNFNFDTLEQSEEESEFAKYRIYLFIIYKSIISLIGSQVIQFLKPILQKLFTQIKIVKFNDLEIILSLFFYCMEGYEQNDQKKFFSEVIIAIVKNNLHSYPHQSVQSLYFDIVSRYSSLVISNQQILGLILKSFISNGFNNPNKFIKFRSYGNFLSFCKVSRKSLYPFIEKLNELIIPFMKIEVEDVEKMENLDITKIFDYKMNLYHAMGLLLTNEQIPSEKRVNILKKLIFPVISSMEEIVKRDYCNKENEKQPKFSIFLSKLISALSYLSKGFPGDGKCKEVTNLYGEILKVVLKVHKAFLHNKFIQQNITFFMRSLISLLPHNSSVKLFSPIIFEFFKQSQKNYELHDTISLTIQIINFQKEKTYSFLNPIFLPLTKKMMEIIKNGEYLKHPDQTEEFSHDRMLNKIYFKLIKNMITKGCLNVFFSKENGNSFNKILDILMMGLNPHFPHLMEISFLNLRLFIERLIKKNNPNFMNYVFQKILPVCFTLPIKKDFDLTDAFYLNFMQSQIITLFKLFVANFPNKFKEFLVKFLGSVVKLNQNQINLFINTIYNSENKKCFEMFLALLKSKKPKEVGN